MKAFAILKAFHDPEEWVTSCELSRRAKLPEASGYRLIQTLEDIGAVVRGPRGRYRTDFCFCLCHAMSPSASFCATRARP